MKELINSGGLDKYNLIGEDYFDGLYKIYDSNKNYFIDIFHFRKFHDGKIHYSNWGNRVEMWPEGYFLPNELYPLKDYKLNDLTVKGPNKNIKYLERHFGNDWKIPKQTHSHYEEFVKFIRRR